MGGLQCASVSARFLWAVPFPLRWFMARSMGLVCVRCGRGPWGGAGVCVACHAPGLSFGHLLRLAGCAGVAQRMQGRVQLSVLFDYPPAVVIASGVVMVGFRILASGIGALRGCRAWYQAGRGFSPGPAGPFLRLASSLCFACVLVPPSTPSTRAA